MCEHLLRLGPHFRVVTEHPVHEPDGFRRGSRYHRLQANLLVLRHRKKLAVGKALRVWPICITRLAKDHADLLELIHLT